MLDKLIRYHAVEQMLGPIPDGTILEIGAGPHGLGCCLPYRFVGVDPWYPEPPVATQQAVKACATALPFSDCSFDYVLCIEVLEHLPLDMRSTVVSEMCRVARRKVIITHPYGRLARIGDRMLAFIYDMLHVLGRRRPWWLVEHLQLPYPDPQSYLAARDRQFEIRIAGQENGIVHPPLIFFTHLKFIARRIERVYRSKPELIKWIARTIHFPPYCRVMVTLTRCISTPAE